MGAAAVALFLGATFTFAGLQKLANPSYLDGSSPLSVQATFDSLQHQSPIGAADHLGALLLAPTPTPGESASASDETSGDFRAFSAVCIHQGCTARYDSGFGFVCPCHGGRYDVGRSPDLSDPRRP